MANDINLIKSSLVELINLYKYYQRENSRKKKSPNLLNEISSRMLNILESEPIFPIIKDERLSQFEDFDTHVLSDCKEYIDKINCYISQNKG